LILLILGLNIGLRVLARRQHMATSKDT
jgi:hypothetical protein